MKYVFDAAFLPSESLKKHDCRIVVDLLRASTQITTFFDAGGEVLIPVQELDAAFGTREKLGQEWKLMGERGGLPAPGFDFGNSPLELKGAGAPKRAIITTSNGTRALTRAAADCPVVLTACVRNAEAAVRDALKSGTNIGILCAGRNGEFSMEDSICAGLLIERLLALATENGNAEAELTDGARVALALWRTFGPDMTKVCMESEHGRILQNLGFTGDILFCAERGKTTVVPRISEHDGITALRSA